MTTLPLEDEIKVEAEMKVKALKGFEENCHKQYRFSKKDPTCVPGFLPGMRYICWVQEERNGIRELFGVVQYLKATKLYRARHMFEEGTHIMLCPHIAKEVRMLRKMNYVDHGVFLRKGPLYRGCPRTWDDYKNKAHCKECGSRLKAEKEKETIDLC